MRLIFMGPPGAGKGTQSDICAQKLNVPKLSTGDMLREEIRQESPLGNEVKSVIARGDLVSDAMIMDIISKRLKESDCINGFILDGFPRTVAQAEALDVLLDEQDIHIDAVISLAVEKHELVKRFTGRRIAEKSERVYHLEYNPPKVEGVCDITGEKLIQRPDDQEDVVTNRLHVYEEQTAPVLAYYENQFLVKEVDGSQSMQNVSKNILHILEK